MSVSLQEQISTLFSCLAMGLGVGLLYDLVRLTLPRRTLQEILDLLFWLGACGMLFFCGIVFGNGRVRLYMALCLLLGATAYFLLLSPWTRRGLLRPEGDRGGPGRRPVSGLGDSAPPVAYSCSHGSVGKNFKKVEKNLEKVLFFFPVVEYNISSNRETWQICRP